MCLKESSRNKRVMIVQPISVYYICTVLVFYFFFNTFSELYFCTSNRHRANYLNTSLISNCLKAFKGYAFDTWFLRNCTLIYINSLSQSRQRSHVLISRLQSYAMILRGRLSPNYLGKNPTHYARVPMVEK